jgi:glycosyltransferase involved in cell wall biosynthesis
MQPEVSIIIPCYNQAKYLPEALASVLAQTFTKWECLVVSDGSPDNVKEVVSKYVDVDPRIIFFDTENGGVSAARNYAISKARGEFILPLDADDKISDNYVEECLKEFQTNNNLTVAYGAGEKFGAVQGKWELPEYSFEKLLFTNIIHPCGFYRKGDAEVIGGYDINMRDGIEDWEFWINLLKSGGKVAKLKSAVFYWRRKEISRTVLINDKITSSLNLYVYNKHFECYGHFFSDPIRLFLENKHLKESIKSIKDNPFRFAVAQLFKAWKIKK